jgi:hypothetical protein
MEKFINRFLFGVFCLFALIGIGCLLGLLWNVATFTLGVFNAEYFDSLQLDWLRLAVGFVMSLGMILVLVHIIDEDELL